MRWPWQRRREYAPIDPGALAALRTALAAGLGGPPVEGFPLIVESIEATLRNVTYDVVDIEMMMAKELLGKIFRHRETGRTYIVTVIAKGKVPYVFRWGNILKVLRRKRRWAALVLYAAREEQLTFAYARTLGDFRANFERVDE